MESSTLDDIVINDVTPVRESVAEAIATLQQRRQQVSEQLAAVAARAEERVADRVVWRKQKEALVKAEAAVLQRTSPKAGLTAAEVWDSVDKLFAGNQDEAADVQGPAEGGTETRKEGGKRVARRRSSAGGIAARRCSSAEKQDAGDGGQGGTGEGAGGGARRRLSSVPGAGALAQGAADARRGSVGGPRRRSISSRKSSTARAPIFVQQPSISASEPDVPAADLGPASLSVAPVRSSRSEAIAGISAMAGESQEACAAASVRVALMVLAGVRHSLLGGVSYLPGALGCVCTGGPAHLSVSCSAVLQTRQVAGEGPHPLIACCTATQLA